MYLMFQCFMLSMAAQMSWGQGSWSSPVSLAVEGVHSAVLNTNEVHFVAFRNPGSNNPTYAFDYTNPVGGTTQQTNDDYLCAGMTVLADGRYLLNGGQNPFHNKATIFDPATNQHTDITAMQRARWYPSTIILGDGKIFTLGGLTEGFGQPDDCESSAEYYDPSTGNWTLFNNGNNIPGFQQEGQAYPRIHLLPDNPGTGIFRIFQTGMFISTKIWEVNVNTNQVSLHQTVGNWANNPGNSVVEVCAGDAGASNAPIRQYNESVRLLDGRFVVLDGLSQLENGYKGTDIIDLSQPSPAWVAGPVKPGSAPNGEIFYEDAVLMPNGNVFVFGGGSGTTDAIYIPDAGTGSWQTTAQDNVYGRQYHSTGALLPDGRVLVASGGGAGPNAIGAGGETGDIQFYSPPYLSAGARPTINSAPSTAGYGQNINVNYSSSNTIADVVLYRHGSSTHHFKYNVIGTQCSFSDGGSSLTVTIPSNPNLIPPGYYSLFILSNNSETLVPSVASWIKIDGSGPPPDTNPPSQPSMSSVTANGSAQITAVSTVSTDAEGSDPVEYQFNETTSNAGATDSGWQTSTTYVDSGLSASTQYCYQVRARDSQGNQTGYSSTSCATTSAGADTTPPTPNPMTFASAPSADSDTAISMTATTASDPSGPVEYQFDETTGGPGATDSAWQTSTSYTDSGLTASTQYTYNVQARDSVGNTTTASTNASATTNAGGGCSGFGSIFNGTDLTGWNEGPESAISGGHVAVSNGEIVFTVDPSIPYFIVTDKNDYSDYEFTCDLKINPNVTNAGPVMRTNNWVPLTFASGRQGLAGIIVNNIDEGGATVGWGALMDPYPDTNPLDCLGGIPRANYNDGDWNSLRITVQGTIFNVWVNGIQTITNFDSTSTTCGHNPTGHTYAAPGRIGLFCHQGGTGTVSYRNLVVTDLSGGGCGGDTDPPTPNPATFASVPNATSSSAIDMTATTATDAGGSTPVEYNFDETSGNAGGTDSGWQTGTSYTDTGLSASTQYCYTVQSRDSLGNTGTASTASCATTQATPDTDPPTPNPATFATVPTAIGDTMITMTATVGSDPSPFVQYDFDETTGNTGATDSGWTTSNIYLDYGLNAATQYIYRVRMRDGVGNTGSYSTSQAVTTAAEDGHVEIQVGPGNVFTPSNVTLNVGDTIDWNFVEAGHNVWSGLSGAHTELLGDPDYPAGTMLFNSSADPTTTNPEATVFSVTFDQSFLDNSSGDAGAPNQYNYHCHVHGSGAPEFMFGVITVNGGTDAVAPIPNPMTFASAPSADSESAISMTATTALDGQSPPVEYFFTELTGNPGGSNSAWQASPSYTDTGLSPSTMYSYTVTARDSSGNVTSASASESATTQAVGGTGINLETGVVSGVGSSWTTVNLGSSYSSMVVVATPNYTNASAPGTVRIQNATGNSFQVRLDGSSTAPAASDIYYMVVEEGVYTQAQDGVTMEAVKYNSTVTSNNNSWVGEAQTYANSYTSPVVVGQVMTYNDAGHVEFWSRGSSRQSPPSSSALQVGKTVNEDPDNAHANETIGYIVVESGSGTMDGVNYTSGVGGDTIRGVTNSPPYSYSISGLSGTASIGIATMAAVDGGNGGWALFYGANPISETSINLAIDEDQLNDTERNHTTEQVSYIVFADQGGGGDTTPPTPNPATFASPPASAGTSSISMTATTASDPSSPVEYFFTETSGNAGGSNSTWQTSTSYTDTLLSPSTQYCYTVTSRDSAGNTGSSSSASCATTDALPDTTPPSPNPATFATAPNSTGETSINMVAGTGSDPSGPVEYQFNETTGGPGATDSGWQTSTTYNDSGLTASTQYCYQVRSRDSVGNTGSYSSAACATTDTPSGCGTTWNSQVNNTSGTISYSGFAGNVSAPGALNNDAQWADAGSATATFSINGNGVRIYVWQFDSSQGGTVSIDGGPAQSFSVGSGSETQVLAFEDTSLSCGPHTVVVTRTSGELHFDSYQVRD